jgi:hypothetical protein
MNEERERERESGYSQFAQFVAQEILINASRAV